MAEEIGKAVAGELVSRGTSLLVNTYNQGRRTDIEEKLFRLEMLVIELRSVSEVTNTADIKKFENLCRWKEKFDEAARLGEQVLEHFKARALLEITENREFENKKTENQETENHQKIENSETENQKIENPETEKKTENQETEDQGTENQKTENKKTEDQETKNQQSGYAFASWSVNVAKRIKRWLSGDNDVNMLNNTLKRLEMISKKVNIYQKLVIVHQRMKKRKRMNSIGKIAYWDGDFDTVSVKWFEKLREVTIEGEHELQLLKCKGHDCEDSSIQYARSLDSLLIRLGKVAKDIDELLV